jgi:signal transduction histidine kinase
MIIAIIGATGVGVWSNRLLNSEFLGLIVARQNANIQSFAETTWREYALLNNDSPEHLAAFRRASAQFMKPQNSVKFTIFSTNVRKLYYGSSSEYITDAEGARVALFDIANIQRGQIAARIIHDAYITSDKARENPRIMVQAIIPIMRAGVSARQRENCATTRAAYCTPQALVEVYTDITKEWGRLANFQFTAGGVVLALIILLSLVLLRATKRAEVMMTKQHEINESLIQTAAAAEASSRDKSEFLTSVSHELRTPLNAIIGFSEILKANSRENFDKESAAYIDDIYGSGIHLLGLINDILDFSKAEAGKLQLDMDEQDLSKIIRNSIRLVIPRAESAQITLVEELPPESLVILTDGKKLKQVLINILGNAVKFTPAGGMVKVAMWESILDKKVIIQITDTGIGIAPKDIPRVLAPFGQVDSKLARKYEGTGLGLPLSKKFVEVMDGTFTLESEEGKGTVITLSLPKALPEPEIAEEEISPPEQAQAEDLSPIIDTAPEPDASAAPKAAFGKRAATDSDVA